MHKSIRFALKLFFWLVVIVPLLVQCKKSEEGPSSGALRWELDLDYSPAGYPLIAGSKIYVQAGTLANSAVAGYDVNTGKKLWQSPSLGAVSIGPFCLVTAEGKTYYMPQSGMQQ